MICSKELSVGNRILDCKHKKLLGMINAMASSAIAMGNAALSDEFELLENDLRAYFVVVENIAQAVRFDFTQHRQAHQDLLNNFQNLKDCLTKNSECPEFASGINSLRNCLIRHICLDCEPLKTVLDTHYYDLKPECMEGKLVLQA